ncbi:MAG: hypothetical protein RMZ42_23875 [Nostoc sp. DedQUE05]|uniref:hypothetical protein n=1 Tax=Nostoc sp. DedQUE05 TaxID=3075391 RepID=UPI002AD52869|nr:hypothetical protein [Nostoc sp. DedQUE05]MDZ8094951.1 hypothetical protein [Nostoc sp. DedQUE05]
MTFLRLYRHGNGSSSWGNPVGASLSFLGEDRTASPEILWQTVTAHNNPIV